MKSQKQRCHGEKNMPGLGDLNEILLCFTGLPGSILKRCPLDIS